MGTRKDDPKCTEEYLKTVKAKLAKIIKDCQFRVVSCLQPSTITALRTEIAAIATERKLVGTAVPRNFKNVQTQLNGLRTHRPLIPLSTLNDILVKVLHLCGNL